MGDKKRAAANQDAKKYGTFNSQPHSSGEKKEDIAESDLYRSRNRIPCRFEVDREAMTQVLLDDASPPFKDINTFPDKVTTAFKNHFSVSCSCVGNFVERVLPVVGWLPKYNIKNNLLLDVLTGVTLLILHVPQGMAYAQLASVPPVYGLYTSFYPVLIYFFLGTSRHVSIGTFAISSLLAGTEVEDIFNMEKLNKNAVLDHMTSTANATANATFHPMTPTYIVHDQIHIAMIITFVVGILQVRRRWGYAVWAT